MQPFIYYVLAFIGNARQLISTCQIKFFFNIQKFYFLKISFFENCVSLYLILFYFSKFFFFEIHCSQLTVNDTVHGLLFTDYCWSQYKNCIATHFQQPLAVLQYNFLSSPSSHNTIQVLQYNPSYCTPVAIQSVVLQYNSSHCTLLQYTLLCCNTILATAHPLQYNLLCCNTILATALSCNTL